ncbi:hypothetical protein [Viridibacillus arvi]|uniref:hypothetical protein n=2 Tax=Viridibacillus TaxID=496496 RepID=UPI003D2C164A
MLVLSFTQVAKAEGKDSYSDLIDPAIEAKREAMIENQNLNKDNQHRFNLFNNELEGDSENEGIDESYESEKIMEEFAEYDKLISEAKDAELEEFLENYNDELPVGSISTRAAISGITHLKQPYSHWCGPTNVVQAMSFHASKQGAKFDAKDWLNKMGILMHYSAKSGSTTSDFMKIQLNNFRNVYNFSSTPYITGTIKEFGNDAANKVVTRLDGVLKKKSNAPIVLVHQYYLDGYKNVNPNINSGHYLTVGSVKKVADKHQAYLYDTNGKHFTKWWEPIGTGKGKKGTLTKAMYEKNLSSPNPVFIY